VPFNPFSPGAYSPVQSIFGREAQLRLMEQAADGIENGVPHAPMCFTGPPGIGKTFLLRNIASELRDRGWLCGYTEAGPDLGSAIDDILADARQMAPHRSAIRRLAARVTGFNAVAPGFSVGLSLQGADSGSAYTRLVGLFREISGRTGSGINGAALLLDEAQVLPDAHLSQLFRALGAVEDSRIVLFMAALPGLAGAISSMSQTDASWRR
jgi:DNA polymerase III delta prime subunit